MFQENKEQISGKKWLIHFVSSVIVMMCFLMVFVFYFDPCFQFRVKNKNYLYFERYVAPGLITNYNYDTLVIGTSRAANFDMDLFRDKLGAEPLLIAMGGMGVKDMTKLMEKAENVDRADKYYICIDFPMFLKDTQLVPEYLYHDDVISRWKYTTSYEAWFRFIPADIGGEIMQMLHINAPELVADKMDIDRYSNWNDYTASGQEVVIEDYEINKEEVELSEADKEEKWLTMKTEIDNFTDGLDFDDADYIFFFPPYSSLWWCDTGDSGHAEIYDMAKNYFVSKISDRGTIYDFQCAEITLDLDNYCDAGHYNQDINDWMIEQFAEQQYIITPENAEEMIRKRDKNTMIFRDRYSWLWEG